MSLIHTLANTYYQLDLLRQQGTTTQEDKNELSRVIAPILVTINNHRAWWEFGEALRKIKGDAT